MAGSPPPKWRIWGVWGGRSARKTEIVKNECCTIRYSPSNGPWQALHGKHRQIPQQRGLHT
eukprot:3076010-Prymnesium_polylepis.1